MLALRGVRKTFADHVALDGVDLEVEAGRTTALIGPSGCGKSTALRLLVGLIQPDAGQVLFAGEPLVPARLREVRRRMGYVIQEGGLFPHLTAAENATLVAREDRWASDRIEARLREMLDLVRLPREALARYPQELSGGQRQRVGIVRALLPDPDVLLFDEPLGALDPMVRRDLQEDLRRVFRSLGKAVVLITHDLAEAAWLGDEIVLMRAGRVLQRGTIEDLVERPADDFVRTFVSAQRPPPGLAQGGEGPA